MNINSVIGYSGKILFGGTNGLVLFDPNMIEVFQEPPQLRFTQLKINNQLIETGGVYLKRIILEKGLVYTDDLRLNHKEKVFSIGFYPSDFNGSEHLIFRYRLRGLHDNWIVDQGESELSFTGLRAGKYSLEIQGSRDNINFGNRASLGIKITPHPLKSPIAIIIYVLIFCAAFAFFWVQYRNKVKLENKLTIAKVEKEKEQEINEAKLTFFTNISHEIRTPLTLILAPVTELLSLNEISKNVRNKLFTVESNANRLLRMINQLLDFRRANRGLLTLAVYTGDFMRFANEIYSSFKGMAESKNIQYKFNTTPKEFRFSFDKDKIEIVIYNLLSNAFKYTPKNGKITFSIKAQNDSCIISIKDSGKGIPESELDKIFDRFYQAKSIDSAKVMGSGIGLSLTKSIVELHQGNITVNSEINKGTEFIITIPVQMVPSTETSKITEAFETKLPEGSVKDLSTGMIDNKEIISSSTETDQMILIVDDNEEIRNYLESIMELEYEVLLAENGNVAIEIASEKIPDLVICDIMMPVMDGIEFSKLLKSQIATSHIPIILLTAKTSTVHEIEGLLSSGADDYIKKPFNPEILKSRVYSLLENRKKFSEHLMNKVRFKPVDNEVENFEEQFIRKAMNYVEEHITIEDFGIEELTDYLCMSQSTLYRKIKSLTGHSISAFIRSVRVKSAAEIILKEDEKLTHVAYMVGFNDYKYFKKCFQKQFGCLPSEYRSKIMGDSSAGTP